MRRRGFTIMELVVVIGMIGVLASMLFPIFARAREMARAAQCAASVAELGLALQMYATDWGGAYPPQEDNLAPVADRVQTDSIFRCPSARYSGITLAQQELLARAREKHVLPWMAGAPSRDDLSYAVVVVDGVLLGSDYYYHAGLTTESPPNAVLVTEREAAHMGRAHVLYASGQVRRLQEEEWRRLIPPAARRCPEDYGEESPPPQSGASQGGG